MASSVHINPYNSSGDTGVQITPREYFFFKLKVSICYLPLPSIFMICMHIKVLVEALYIAEMAKKRIKPFIFRLKRIVV